MKNLKLQIVTCILFCSIWSFASQKNVLLNKHSEIEKAFHQHDFLIGEYLNLLNIDTWIAPQLNKLDKNIYLSTSSQNRFFTPIWIVNGISFRNHSISKNLLYQSALNYQISGLEQIYNYQYTKAISSFTSCLQNFDLLKDTTQIINNSFHLSKLHFLIGDYSKAAEFQQLAEGHLKMNNKKIGLVNALLWKTQIYLSKGYYNDAENLILKRILLIKQNKLQEQKCYYLLGKLYLKTNRYTQAKWFFIQAYELANKINYKQGQIFSLVYLAKTKNTISNFSLALSDLQKAKSIAYLQPIYLQIDLYLALNKTYSYLHSQNKASENQLKFQSLQKQFFY